MSGQLSILPPLPRKPRRVLMHVIDAGEAPDETQIVRFQCRCGYESGWLEMRTVSEEKRGRPCPKCTPTPKEGN